MLKSILVFLLLYWFFRSFLKRMFPQQFKQPPTPNTDLNSQNNTLVACSTCGVYNPVAQSLKVGEKYFCNQSCVK